MIDAFDTVCKVGKDVYRVAIAATNMEYDAFLGQDDDGDRELPLISGLTFQDEEISGILGVGRGDYAHAAKLSSEAAVLLTEELNRLTLT